MVKRSDGFWQATISVPSGATQVNMAFNNNNGTWDSNNGSNYNITIGAVSSSPNPPVAGQQVTITYAGSLASGATSLTMHWGDNNWNGVTNTSMTKQSNGTWTATVTVPTAATVLNMDFYNQNNTWDNNSTYNYDVTVS